MPTEPALNRVLRDTPPERAQLRRLGLGAAAVLVVFAWPLAQLGHLALTHDLYSHVLLIPVVTVYLAWQSRQSWLGGAGSPWAAIGIFAMAGLLAAMPWLLPVGVLAPEDTLTFTTLGFIAAIAGLLAAWVGARGWKPLRFPIGFLLFMVPLPPLVVAVIEGVLQRGSAITATFFFDAVGTPILRNDTLLRLPGITIDVAPECSGIHSTLVLVITSVIAARIFLRSPWRRGLLIALTVPLALLRNAFRIFVIGELCVQISPDMINSYIHRHGGPIFFALSLIPFLGVLILLMRSEAASVRPATSASLPCEHQLS